MGERFLGVLARSEETVFPLPPPPGHGDRGPNADPWSAAGTFPEIAGWQGALAGLGITTDMAVHAAARARVQNTAFEVELVACGFAGEDALYRSAASALAVPYAAILDPSRLILRDRDCLMLLNASGPRPVRVDDGEGHTAWAISPDGHSILRLRALIRRKPQEARRIWIVAPKTLRAALLERARPLLAAEARNGLFDRAPMLSARIVANAWQGGAAGAFLVLLPLALVLAPGQTLLIAHAWFSLFFLACVGLRFAAIRAPSAIAAPDFSQLRLDDLPTYSVLVALHREAAVIGQLLPALGAIVWPRGKLDIKLVCEADDAETIAAIRAHGLPSHVELLEVPPGQPRTKPKALAYALQVATGEFVVLYDAEDRPHPMQLMEAWLRFSAAPQDLACLQAPLEIANPQASAIARLFAFEYCGLFRGLLPFLADCQTVLPLGGTSNHFRAACLQAVGGWDPYNVTEDADLGVRLARFGYRTGTLTLPTLEDAPETLKIWLPQRTRWFKGWLVTWLVHMRAPATLWRELGPRSFVIMQILSAGLVVSALVHPLLVACAAWLAASIALGDRPGPWQSWLIAVDVANIACGYLSFLLLGWQQMRRGEKKGFWRTVLFTPVYWAMLSWAGWRALLHLWQRPHHWEKTPHFRRTVS